MLNSQCAIAIIVLLVVLWYFHDAAMLKLGYVKTPAPPSAPSSAPVPKLKEPESFTMDGGFNIGGTVQTKDDEIYSYPLMLADNVDESIIQSHREYVQDTEILGTTGASHASARDDFSPPVQFHGFPRKAHYANLGAEITARQGQSETPEEVIDVANHNSYGYTF